MGSNKDESSSLLSSENCGDLMGDQMEMGGDTRTRGRSSLSAKYAAEDGVVRVLKVDGLVKLTVIFKKRGHVFLEKRHSTYMNVKDWCNGKLTF